MITINPGDNGDMRDLIRKKFNVRIFVGDSKTYDKIIDYLEAKALKSGLLGEELSGNERYYVFDKEGKQIVKTGRIGRLLQLTSESIEIRDAIEKIIYQTA